MGSPPMLAPMTNVRSALSLPFVHRHYILLKAHYFFFFSSFGILYPIISITLRGRGLSKTEIAFTNLIIPFIVFFTNPLLGYIADHSRRYLFVFNCILTVLTSLYTTMFLLPPLQSDNIIANIYYNNKLGHVLDFCGSQEVGTKCSSRSECGCSYKSFCKTTDLRFNFTFTMNSTDTRQKWDGSFDISESSKCGIEYRVPIDKHIQDYKSNLSSDNENKSSLARCELTCSIAHYCLGKRYPKQTNYALLYSLLFIAATDLFTVGITIGASIGFATLPRPEIFGQQRVWGTIGFGISAFIASRLYEKFKTELVYIIMFTITTVICICVTSFIRIQPHRRELHTTNNDLKNNEQVIDDITVKNTGNKNKSCQKSRFKTAALIPLIKRIDVIAFFSMTFIWGMSYAVLDPVRILFQPYDFSSFKWTL